MKKQHLFNRCACAAFGIVFGLTVGACDMLDTHPYDAKIEGETGLTLKNVRRIETALQGRKTFRFAMISDTQRWYDETDDVVRALNKRGDLDFVVHGGDLTDFGMTEEFLWQRDILTGLRMPWVGVIGNHDCLATGESVYRKVFGPLNYVFTAGDVRFLMLNTNALEYDHTEAVPDLKFLLEQLSDLGIQPPDTTRHDTTSGVERTIVVMHAGPTSEVFDKNVDVVFETMVRMFPNLMFCLYGHEHQLNVKDMFGDGVLYYQCPNIKKRQYLVFTIKEEGYTYEAVDF